MVESKVEFPFRPSVGEDYQWTQIQHASSLNPFEQAFLEAITHDLGSSRRSQSRIYSTANLLSEDSLRWYGISVGLDDRKRELDFEVEHPNYDWTIHLGGVFSIQCEPCNSTVRGCGTGLGNLFSPFYACLFSIFVLTLSCFVVFLPFLCFMTLSIFNHNFNHVHHRLGSSERRSKCELIALGLFTMIPSTVCGQGGFG